jgi:hypothetical protein
MRIDGSGGSDGIHRVGLRLIGTVRASSVSRGISLSRRCLEPAVRIARIDVDINRSTAYKDLTEARLFRISYYRPKTCRTCSS